MTVRAILSLKGHAVTTASPEILLLEAAKLLSEHRIGALVITEGSKVIGILSERDIVRAVARRGDAAMTLPVREFMTKGVITCEPDDKIDVLMMRMTAGRFRHLPVLNEQGLDGIVSIGDVVKFRLAEMERESEALKQYILTA